MYFINLVNAHAWRGMLRHSGDLAIRKVCRVLLILVAFSLGAAGQELRIDHVIILHPDLEAAVSDYKAMGYTIKPGRLHDNGLLNAHIKFDNGSSLELMALADAPTDRMARQYAQLLDDGVHGAYLALTGPDQAHIETALKRLSIDYEILRGAIWTYITFDQESEFAHIFFICYDRPPAVEPAHQTTHTNGVLAMEQVTIEGSARLTALLEQLEVKGETGTSGNPVFKTPTGKISIAPSNIHQRPRIHGITLAGMYGRTRYIPLD